MRGCCGRARRGCVDLIGHRVETTVRVGWPFIDLPPFLGERVNNQFGLVMWDNYESTEISMPGLMRSENKLGYVSGSNQILFSLCDKPASSAIPMGSQCPASSIWIYAFLICRRFPFACQSEN